MLIASFQLTQAALGLALSFAAMPVGGGNTEYELHVIEPWNTTYALATSSISGINDRNEVSGCATTEPLGQPCSFLWTASGGKVPIDLAGVINNAGVIAGAGAVRWADGTVELFPNDFSYPHALNEQNVVAGLWGLRGCPHHGSATAAVWDSQNGSRLLDRGTFNVLAADEAFGINDFNHVVGVRSTTGDCGDYKAFYLELDTSRQIDLHLEWTGSSQGITRAFDINNRGVIVGDGPINGVLRPFLWSENDGFTFPAALPGGALMDTELVSLNDHGTAVGASLVNLDWSAIVWDATRGTRNLNDLVDLPPGFVIDRAIAINQNGWIIGAGHTGSWSPERAVVLVPTEPWSDLGHGLTSPSQAPLLQAIGAPSAGTSVTLSLDGALPGALALLVVGTQAWYQPFQSGVLVPRPALFLPFAVDGAGELDFSAPWPDPSPADAIYLQYWLFDAGVPAASNALRANVR